MKPTNIGELIDAVQRGRLQLALAEALERPSPQNIAALQQWQPEWVEEAMAAQGRPADRRASGNAVTGYAVTSRPAPSDRTALQAPLFTITGRELPQTSQIDKRKVGPTAADPSRWTFWEWCCWKWFVFWNGARDRSILR